MGFAGLEALLEMLMPHRKEVSMPHREVLSQMPQKVLNHELHVSTASGFHLNSRVAHLAHSDQL